MRLRLILEKIYEEWGSGNMMEIAPDFPHTSAENLENILGVLFFCGGGSFFKSWPFASQLTLLPGKNSKFPLNIVSLPGRHSNAFILTFPS